MLDRLVPTARRAATLALAVALAAPAAAQSQWTPPQRVSGPQASQIVTLDHDGAGGGLLVWSAQPGPFYDTAHRPARDSAWQAGPRLPSRLAYLHAKPAVSLYGVTRALLVASRRGGEGDSLRYAMVAAFGRSDGTFGALRPLDAGAIEGRDAPRSLSSPALAASPAGDAVTAWARSDGRVSVVRLTERRAGGPLQSVRTISPPGAGEPAVAINARRDRVVAWYRAGWIEARVRRAGAGWGSVLKVARPARRPATLKAAVDGDGRFLLAWSTLDYREGRPSVLTFAAAVRAVGRGWVHRPLDRYSASGVGFSQAERRLDAVFDSAGRGLIAWEGKDATGAPAAKLARLGAGSVIAGTQTVAAGVRLTDLAAGPRRRASLVWDAETGDSALRSRIGTAVGTSGIGFAPAETLPATCPAAAFCVPLDPRAAFDPAGALTVAWLQRTDAAWEVWVSTRTAP